MKIISLFHSCALSIEQPHVTENSFYNENYWNKLHWTHCSRYRYRFSNKKGLRYKFLLVLPVIAFITAFYMLFIFRLCH